MEREGKAKYGSILGTHQDPFSVCFIKNFPRTLFILILNTDAVCHVYVYTSVAKAYTIYLVIYKVFMSLGKANNGQTEEFHSFMKD